jgi:hypothetical protein
MGADSVPILLAPAYGELVSLATPLGAYRQHRKDDGSFISNNAPTGLWNEYERITSTKRFVERALGELGQRPRVPQWLAPWEARIVALCVRFGGAAGRPGGGPSGLMRHALHSVWRWPEAGWSFKALLAAWMLGVWLAPRPLARRLAAMHRRAVGAATLV